MCYLINAVMLQREITKNTQTNKQTNKASLYEDTPTREDLELMVYILSVDLAPLLTSWFHTPMLLR